MVEDVLLFGLLSCLAPGGAVVFADSLAVSLELGKEVLLRQGGEILTRIRGS